MQAAARWQCWALIAAFVLAGCASVPPPTAGDAAPVPYVMLPPNSLGHGLSLSQVVTGEYDGRRYSMRFEVEVSATRLVMIGLSHLGVSLFSLKQDAGGLSVESFTADRLPFDPRHILSDFQLTNWPKEELMHALSPARLRLEDDVDHSRRRVFDSDGALLIEITNPARRSAAGDTIVQHFDRPYRLRIKTLEAKETP